MVLAVSLRAGAVGFNLQDVSYVFYLDRWWNPGVQRQVEDRSQRYGYPLPANAFKCCRVSTIEERIDRMLKRP